MTESTPQAAGSAQGLALIGLSISVAPNLAPLGFGTEHLRELTGSLARTVLRIPEVETALVYGGDLRPGQFTRQLFEIASDERAKPTKERPEPPRRIYNYLAWPHYLSLARGDEAQMINACHFMRIAPRHAGFPDIPDVRAEGEQRDPPATLVRSRCLTRMRELSTRGGHPDFDGHLAPALKARILLGGQTSGYSSLMPGLFEEFLLTRDPGPDGQSALPIYVIGAFGGAAGELATALLDPKENVPLTMEYQLRRQEGRRLDDLVKLYQANPELPAPREQYLALSRTVESLGKAIRSTSQTALDNGLTPEENRCLLRSRDMLEIRRLIQRGLSAICRPDRSEVAARTG